MADLTNKQKKEWAGMLYLKENLTQQEIADKVGVSRITVNKWIKAEMWEQQKTGITLTRESVPPGGGDQPEHRRTEGRGKIRHFKGSGRPDKAGGGH